MINFQLTLNSYHLYFKVYWVTIVCVTGQNRSFKLQVKAFIYPWIETLYHKQCTVEITTYTEESIPPSVGGQWWSERVKARHRVLLSEWSGMLRVNFHEFGEDFDWILSIPFICKIISAHRTGFLDNLQGLEIRLGCCHVTHLLIHCYWS